MSDVDVLVAGAGPVGLTAAAELRRRGIRCRVIDRLLTRRPFAKAVGVQPRTLEIWDRMGMVRDVLEAAVPLRGQLLFVNGEEQPRIDLTLPPDVPYGFAALPQYETERLLEGLLHRCGGHVERGVELLSFEQDANEVRVRIAGPSGERQELTAGFLIGCDGAHSLVRKGLGLSFEGAALPEEYMLGDVEVDWDLPPGYGVRAMHRSDGRTDDLLVGIPLPGRGRYRMSMLTPPELSRADEAVGEGVAHGLTEGDGAVPGLEHIQAVLDRLSPRPATASSLRWSSVFRISHRIVDRYGEGRVFVAGDAAHIHPPTGAQGMNTGIQDAYNLAWKLASIVRGEASDRLPASYDAERRPVGEEVVQRTVRHASSGIEADPDDPSTLIRREAQLLVGYRDSPVVAHGSAATGNGRRQDGPVPGDRAPDCGGLRYALTAFPSRLFDLLREREHVLLLYVDGEGQAERYDEVAAAARQQAHGRLDVLVVAAPQVEGALPGLPTVHDDRDEFRQMYGARGGAGFLVRPDGYLGLRADPADGPGLSSQLSAHLSTVFRA
ncbi:FAD-dependent monooxygenase [Streptomyces sp. NPDC051322]|uniref:FAD-dependent monooxygenase n=1 Tax=Streptomyces sp. NPDC051322 TaxID=3154645 RepID=UPI00344EF745